MEKMLDSYTIIILQDKFKMDKKLMWKYNHKSRNITIKEKKNIGEFFFNMLSKKKKNYGSVFSRPKEKTDEIDHTLKKKLYITEKHHKQGGNTNNKVFLKNSYSYDKELIFLIELLQIHKNKPIK